MSEYRNMSWFKELGWFDGNVFVVWVNGADDGWPNAIFLDEQDAKDHALKDRNPHYTTHIEKVPFHQLCEAGVKYYEANIKDVLTEDQVKQQLFKSFEGWQKINGNLKVVKQDNVDKYLGYYGNRG